MVNDSDEAPVAGLMGEIIRDRRAEILGLYDELLIRASGRRISSAASRHLHRQAVAVLNDVSQRLIVHGPGGVANRPAAAPPPRPPEELPPRESLRAAGALSEAVLTTVAGRLPEHADAV